MYKAAKMAINLKKENILRASTSYNIDNIDMIFLSEKGEYLDAGNINNGLLIAINELETEYERDINMLLRGQMPEIKAFNLSVN